jgi:hypothetical protein
MERFTKILKFGFVFLIFTSFLGTGCVTSKKNSYYSKKSKSSHVSTSQLGRNRYYFSVGYQKKLTKNYKK